MNGFRFKLSLLVVVLCIAVRGEALADTCGDYLQSNHTASSQDASNHTISHEQTSAPADLPAPCDSPHCSKGVPRPAPVTPSVVEVNPDREAISLLPAEQEPSLIRSASTDADDAAYSFEFCSGIFHPPRMPS